VKAYIGSKSEIIFSASSGVGGEYFSLVDRISSVGRKSGKNLALKIEFNPMNFYDYFKNVSFFSNLLPFILI
jgi:hypothetical protein